jgi:hypothetical protein
MKKQVIAAAVAATMSAVAVADISITGSGKANYTYTDNGGSTADTNAVSHEFDLHVVGKSGDTSVVMNIENTTSNNSTIAASAITMTNSTDVASDGEANGGTIAVVTSTSATQAAQSQTDELNVKNAYMTTKIGDVNIKFGDYYGSDYMLGNATLSEGKLGIDTTVGGVKLQYESQPESTGTNNESFTISGEVQGIKLSHEIWNAKDETSIIGSVGPVSVEYRQVDSDTASEDKDSLVVSAAVQGIEVTYANIDAGTSGTTTDAFFGEFTTATDVMDADGFGVKTSLAGNTVNVKSYEVTNTSSAATDYTKVIVTRPLASGATFELTYTDKDTGTQSSSSETLDLELAVKF